MRFASVWRGLRAHLFVPPPNMDDLPPGGIAWCWCKACRPLQGDGRDGRPTLPPDGSPFKGLAPITIRTPLDSATYWPDPDPTILAHLTGPHGRPTP